eukprot:Skav227214  [mRNA]  locus=scaffold2048:377373:380557:- [translate_table: standard]
MQDAAGDAGDAWDAWDAGDACVDRRKSWVAVACSDGAVRLVDTSPQRAASVVRTSYAHGVEATAAAISWKWTDSIAWHLGKVVAEVADGRCMLEADEAAIEALCYSSLRQEPAGPGSPPFLWTGVWDAGALRHSCRFPLAHRGPARGLSFSTQNSDLLITGGNDAELIFWDVKTLRMQAG